jgi:vacuolar-type H+-ATPase subunit H
MNSAELVSSLYEYTSSSKKNEDSNSIENLLTSSMSANNPAMARLAHKAESQDYYKKALSAGESANEKLYDLMGEKSVFVKTADTEDEELLEEYQTRATQSIAEFLNSYNTMVSNLTEAGGKTNKNFLSELNDTMRTYGTALSGIGITRNADGTLAMDADTLAGADLDTLEDIFGPEADFANQMKGQMDHIVERTATTVDTLQIYSTAYSNSGSYSQYDYLKGLYDLKA